MNITHRLLLVIALGAGWAQQGSAAVTKYNLADADLRHLLFIENQEDNNLSVIPHLILLFSVLDGDRPF